MSVKQFANCFNSSVAVRYSAGNIKYFGTNQVEGNHKSVKRPSFKTLRETRLLANKLID